MFDTVVTIVGNAITAPEWRRLQNQGPAVANFKVASTSRRYDKETGRWVDGPSLRVRVTCWRRLAEGVAASVFTGDPVIVTGRMYTRDWVAEDGQHRVSYELDAVAVGHDLARGMGTFQRHRANTATSAVEDAESDARVGGAPSAVSPGSEPTEPPWRSGQVEQRASAPRAAQPHDGPVAGQGPPSWPAGDGTDARREPGVDPELGYVRGDLDDDGPLDPGPVDDELGSVEGSRPAGDEADGADTPAAEGLTGGETAATGGGRRRRSRATVPA
jgi:single-strand DNA-binding protein